ncbi:phosphoribosyl-AMP cyclohydrolase [Roseibium aquae]|uniref:Phosphoribosyl-AMP cyclohydrolase n=1 Tax=Roseibium aquae TaxID=1323746 RepID=A0A916TMS6_9HYPH|nr:phosphoribosyl-AMP cyclohydrolase [Roseibium aquae]GGB59628.1 phosphoribosyl-AMP cyclohydrolase [Roseibium aquae]
MTDLSFAKRGSKTAIETGREFSPKFDGDGLIVAVVTDYETNEVLMVGYMNAEALKRTIETGEAWYWSRSRKSFWKKGETSGQVQKVREILTDCDQDALVVKVRVEGNGATCHVGYRSCFYRAVDLSSETSVALNATNVPKVYEPEDVYGKS